MNPADIARLVSLAAIWGASFMCVRYAAPAIDAAWLTALRVGLAALAMLAYARATGLSLEWRRHWRTYTVMGLLHTALPWSMYAAASHSIGAGTMAILNATTPWFGALFGAIWLGEKMTPRKLAGLALGIAGVAALTGLAPVAMTGGVLAATGLSVLACICYALAGTYVKLRNSGAPPLALTTGSLIVATLAVLPFVSGPPPLAALASPKVATAVLNLALVCSAAAFVIYYRLLANVGPTRALTVTFLIPVFGVLFGALLLGETVTLPTVAGGLLIIIATALVAGGGRSA